MYLGRPAEQGDKETIFERPRHPYTKALLASTPGRRSQGPRQAGIVSAASCPRPSTRPAAAPSTSAAPMPPPIAPTKRPELRRVDGRLVACHYAESIG